MLTRLTLLLLLSTLGIATAGEASLDAAKQTVETFYRQYLADTNAFIERTDRKTKPTPDIHWKPWFTKECWAAYQKVKKTPDLDYDPILQSNDVPTALKVEKIRAINPADEITKSGKPQEPAALARLKYIGYVESTPLLEVRLKQHDGQWLIDAIGDLNK